MKPRNREINIFSLSLMDVISGAMGAFLIVMVLLSQYYVFDPETSEDADDLRQRLDAAIAGLSVVRNGTEQIFSELISSNEGASTTGIGGAENAADIEALAEGVAADIDRVSNHLEAVHVEMNRLEEDLQQANAQLARAEGLVERFEMRRPLVVGAHWDCDANIDLFIESDRVSVDTNTGSALFDPRARAQQNFTGDATSDTTRGPASEMSLVSETPKNSRYKIFINLMAGPVDVVCGVVTHALGYDGFFAVPPVATLTFAESFEYLGAVTVDDAWRVAYRPPTASERASELAAVRKRIAEKPRTKTTP